MTDLKIRGGLGYSWAVAGFCDLLRGAGVAEPVVDQLTRENPLRLADRGARRGRVIRRHWVPR